MIKIEFLKSIQGSEKENEDVADFYKNYCWIIDGATDLFESSNKIGCSVGEIVNQISVQISKFCDDRKTLEEILIASISQVSQQFFDFRNHSQTFFSKLPTFSIIFCREIDNQFEYLILGDCYLIYDGNVITDNRISRFSKMNKMKLKNALKQSSTISPNDRLSILQAVRLKANARDGYPIGSMYPDSIKNAIKGSFTHDQLNSFIIMSDGFYSFYNSDKPLLEISNYIEFDLGIDNVYGKKDDASVLKGVLI